MSEKEKVKRTFAVKPFIKTGGEIFPLKVGKVDIAFDGTHYIWRSFTENKPLKVRIPKENVVAEVSLTHLKELPKPKELADDRVYYSIVERRGEKEAVLKMLALSLDVWMSGINHPKMIIYDR